MKRIAITDETFYELFTKIIPNYDVIDINDLYYHCTEIIEQLFCEEWVGKNAT